MRSFSKKILGTLLLLPLLTREALGLGLDDFREEVFRPDNLPASRTGDTSAEGRISEVVDFLIDLILYASGAVAVLMLIIGGIMYISYTGNDERLEKAKTIIKYALMGLFAVILAFALVSNIIDLIFRATA